MSASATSDLNAAGPRTNAEHRIRVRGLGKSYGALEVFRDVDFEVGTREIVAIVGPSGCGKTTLLRCLDCLTRVERGDFIIDQ